jgi:hypothetical protein
MSMLPTDGFAAVKTRLTIPPFEWLVTNGAQFLIIHKLHHRYPLEQVCNGRELNQAIHFGPAGAVYQFFKVCYIRRAQSDISTP